MRSEISFPASDNNRKGVKCFEEVEEEMWTAAAVVVVGVTLALISSRGDTASSLTNPHIIYILADDLGWNDVGFHGSNQIPTPNIDALAYTGIILNNYYVAPICTPSRSALMTGKYPIHTGLQHGVIHGSTPYGLDTGEKILPEFLKNSGYGCHGVGKWHLGMQHRVIYGGEPWGLGLQETILPEYLKEAGYNTSAVGKWHLGHFKQSYLPLARGFDSHYGYWTGHQDYYDHTAIEKFGYWGFDMRRGMNISWTDYGKYTTDLLTDEAVKIIKNHDSEKPLFLYLAHLATHSANPYSPLQAPLETVSKFKYIENKKRRLFAGMLSKLDDSVGSVVEALAEANMLTNSIIIFSTDNGGPAAGFDLNAASNWPLRGVKDTLWEGGVRGASFVWSPLLPSSKVSNDLMHITDWLPTLLFVTNNTNSLNNIDGVNMWQSLSRGTPSPRQEILLNIDTERNVSALRHGRWKYIKGTSNDWNKWYGPDGRNSSYNWKALYNSPTAKVLQPIRKLPDKTIIKKLRNAAKVVCNNHETDHDSTGDVYLFDLDKDPCEQHNLASTHQDIVKSMEEKLKAYLKTVVKPRNKETDPRSNPIYWGHAWTNWMDYVENENEFPTKYLI